jgi:HPt (histidine-containing phosphotransfer) domain-containing protein
MPELEPDEGQVKEVFDRAGLLDRVMGDEELADEIVQDFLRDAPSHVATLESLIAGADPQGAGLQAHFIKGAAATVGAGALWALALEMEKAGKAGDLDALRAGVPRFADELTRLADEVGG